MLLWLTEYLSQYVSGFAVFQYLTFRTMVSVATALTVSLLIGPFVIICNVRLDILLHEPILSRLMLWVKLLWNLQCKAKTQ